MKQALTWVLCATLFVTMVAGDAAAVQPVTPEKPQKPTALSKSIEQLGVGTNTLVAVRLQNKSIVSGYIGETSPEYFVVIDAKTGKEAKVAYTQVSRLEAFNLVTGAQVHQGTGLRSRLVRGLQHVLPIQPVQQNNLRKGPLIVVGIAVLVAILLIVKLT